MTIAYRTGNWATIGSQTGGVQNINVPIPGAVQAGDVMLIVVEVNAASTAYSLAGPVDWTQLEYLENGSQQGALYYKVAEPGDAGTTAAFTVTALAGGAGAKGCAVLAAYSGAQLDDSASFGDTETTGIHPTPIITPSAYPAWIVIGIAKKGDGLTTLTPPAGYTLREDVFQTGGGACGAAIADIPLASGSSDGGSWTTDATTRNFTTFAVSLIEAAELPASVIKVRSGGAWVNAAVYVRSGGTWIPASIKVRSGGTWT